LLIPTRPSGAEGAESLCWTVSLSVFRNTGVVVLRGFCDPRPLCVEVDRALADARRRESAANTGNAGNAFEYVPMMCERAPVSVALLDALAVPAAELLGREVIPTRAKGTRYLGGTSWHRDSDMDLASVGLAEYLEPLDAQSGALRVICGSHLSGTATAGPELVGGCCGTEAAQHSGPEAVSLPVLDQLSGYGVER
jgi:hypothetical protein